MYKRQAHSLVNDYIHQKGGKVMGMATVVQSYPETCHPLDTLESMKAQSEASVSYTHLDVYKRQVIWIPPLLASMLSGMISVLFSLRCNVQGSAMGLTGLLGLTDSFSIMATTYWIPLFLIDVVLPMVCLLYTSRCV